MKHYSLATIKSHLLFRLCIICFTGASFTYGQEDWSSIPDEVKQSVVRIETFNFGEPLGQGTAFFVSDTILVTNKHVLRFADSACVRLQSGDVCLINGVVAESKETDLVLLSISQRQLGVRFLQLSSEQPRVGHRILVVGNPLGLDWTVTDGIVSSIRNMEGYGNVLQISAPISPGSSGSPVVDRRGRVVGVATFLVRGGQSLNFAIPSTRIPQKRHFEDFTSWSLLFRGKCRNECDTLNRNCYENYKAGNYSSAITICKDASDCNPTDLYSRFNVAESYKNLGYVKEAIEWYQICLARWPENPLVLGNAGRLYARIGEIDAALDCLKKLKANIGRNEYYLDEATDLQKTIAKYNTRGKDR